MLTFFSQLSRFKKLLIAFLGVAVVSVGFISVIYYFSFKNALIQRTKDQLISINILKKIQVEDHLKNNPEYSSEFLEYIMQERTGMGNSGESYLVDQNGLLITRSRFFPNKNPKSLSTASIGFKNAISGFNGAEIYKDYRNVEVIGAFGSIKIGNKQLAILSEIDFEEAMKPVYSIRNYFLAFGCFVCMMVALVSIWLAKTLSLPIKRLNLIINDISRGKLETIELSQFSNDEIGQMGRSLQKLIEALQQKTSFAQQIGRGDFHSIYRTSGDLDELGIVLLKMREDLIRLKEADKKLIRLRSAAILEGEDRERKRLAMDLHDGLGQLLTALKFTVEALEETVPAKVKLREILNESILEIRKIAQNVMPSVLLDFGLVPALKQLTNNFLKEFGANVIFKGDVEEEQIPFDFSVKVGIYRIVQEAFTNIQKYSSASLVEILISIHKGKLILEMMDNGSGFDYESTKLKSTNGLRNMRERTKLMGGVFSIDTKIGGGTKISLEIPIEDTL